MHLPSMPIWFDPTLPGEARGYVGAVWLAGVVPALLAGAVSAGILGGIVGIAVWTSLCSAGARAFRGARRAWLRATRSPGRCPGCGERTFSSSCPGCGSPVLIATTEDPDERGSPV
jgi:hypothetical protein